MVQYGASGSSHAEDQHKLTAAPTNSDSTADSKVVVMAPPAETVQYTTSSMCLPLNSKQTLASRAPAEPAKVVRLCGNTTAMRSERATSHAFVLGTWAPESPSSKHLLTIATMHMQILACCAGPQRALPEAQSFVPESGKVLSICAVPGPAALQGATTGHAEHADRPQGPLCAEHAAQ